MSLPTTIPNMQQTCTTCDIEFQTFDDLQLHNVRNHLVYYQCGEPVSASVLAQRSPHVYIRNLEKTGIGEHTFIDPRYYVLEAIGACTIYGNHMGWRWCSVDTVERPNMYHYTTATAVCHALHDPIPAHDHDPVLRTVCSVLLDLGIVEVNELGGMQWAAGRTRRSPLFCSESLDGTNNSILMDNIYDVPVVEADIFKSSLDFLSTI